MVVVVAGDRGAGEGRQGLGQPNRTGEHEREQHHAALAVDSSARAGRERPRIHKRTRAVRLLEYPTLSRLRPFEPSSPAATSP